MKKTVTASISSIIFTLEEDAFILLNSYLKEIESYFSDSEERKEIMADIEARIAEMLQQKLNTKINVVSENDINEIIEKMGSANQFADAEENSFTQNETSSNKAKNETQSKSRKRLYRDSESRILGGVCAGLGHYFGIDPVLIRVLWAVALFMFGIGFFAYLILWIIVPKAITTAEKLEMKGEAVNFKNIAKAVEEEAENLKKKWKR
jgi:phage shock protein PspC (stress-responsive transcriptional regulator)